MNLKEIANHLKLDFTSKHKFEVEVDHIGKEFCAINFNSKEKDQQSFTVLVLPQLPKGKGEWKGWGDFLGVNNKELFGDNSKGV